MGKSVFQQIDIEENIDGNAPTLRMYGVTEVRQSLLHHFYPTLNPVQNGHSVLAHINDFLPYFYIPQPRGFQLEDIEPFMEHLNVILPRLIRRCNTHPRFRA